MDGDLELVSSAPGIGTEFKASLKIEIPEGTLFLSSEAFSFELVALPKPEQKTKRLVGLSVLVVEDSPDNRELIEILLTEAGAQVDLADDGRDGVQKAFLKNYDAVLMDIQMPFLDGHQAAEQLRAKGFKSPLVALTAHAMKEEQERCIHSGFTHFLPKPIQYESMLSVLENFKPAIFH
jgi:CheY-like chemotaxis protein